MEQILQHAATGRRVGVYAQRCVNTQIAAIHLQPGKLGFASSGRRDHYVGASVEAYQVQTADEYRLINPEDIGPLSQQVQVWFQQATLRFEVPSIEICQSVAFYILLLRGQEKNESADSEAVVKGARDWI
jgi:hypothetical protein